MKRTALENWICRVEGISSLTRAELGNLQLSRLNEVLAREHERNGFYKDIPNKLSSLSELSALPFTSPDELSSKGGSMLLCSQSDVGRVVSGVTSGTTGPPKRLFYSASDLKNTVGFFAAGISELTSPDDVVMIAMPFSGPYGLGDLIASAVEGLGARALRVGIGLSYAELSRILLEECPSVYIGMPVPLLSLLRFCGHTSLSRALVSGDACPNALLSQIEALLGTRLFPHYGSRECGLGGAVTCEAHEGMHIRENHIIAEIIDKHGCPLPDGDWGELVISTIGLEAQPLLRYRSGDLARILPEPCPCGGVTRRLEVAARIAPSEAAMSKLDERLFQFPWLADYSARRQKDGIELEARTIGQGSVETLLKAAIEALPEAVFSAKLRPLDPGDKSAYLGKRSILSEKTD